MRSIIVLHNQLVGRINRRLIGYKILLSIIYFKLFQTLNFLTETRWYNVSHLLVIIVRQYSKAFWHYIKLSKHYVIVVISTMIIQMLLQRLNKRNIAHVIFLKQIGHNVLYARLNVNIQIKKNIFIKKNN